MHRECIERIGKENDIHDFNERQFLVSVPLRKCLFCNVLIDADAFTAKLLKVEGIMCS